MYSIHGEQFISGFWAYNNVDRALVSEHPKFNLWYYYLLIVPLSLLPWTPVICYQLKASTGRTILIYSVLYGL